MYPTENRLRYSLRAQDYSPAEVERMLDEWAECDMQERKDAALTDSVEPPVKREAQRETACESAS